MSELNTSMSVLRELLHCREVRLLLAHDDARPVSVQMSRTKYSSLRDEFAAREEKAWAAADALVDADDKASIFTPCGVFTEENGRYQQMDPSYAGEPDAVTLYRKENGNG